MKTDALIILSPGFAKDETDDSCLVSQQLLVRSINLLYPRITIIILAFQYPFTNKPCYWFGNYVIPFNGRNRGGLLRRWTWRKVHRTLDRLQQIHRIKGLLSFWCGEAAKAGALFATKHNLPHFCWIAGQDARPGNHYISQKHLPAVSLVAISDHVADEFEKNYHYRPAHVIPNGIIPQLPGAGMAKTTDIIAVGSLIPLKRMDWVIDTVYAISQQFPGISALICGDGPEKKKLLKKIQSLGLEKNIGLTGAVDHVSVIKLMQQSKVLLHPSVYEGFPTVCLEALDAGCHVISSLQPMHRPISNWYIKKDKTAILQQTLALLEMAPEKHNSNFEFTMERTATLFMSLYPGIVK